MAFFAELQRRRVGKVAIAYGAVAWAATEASSVVLPALHVPEWVLTAIVVFLLVGFPIAMALAWIFDVGPEGISRTEPQAPPAAQVKLRVAYAAVVIVCMGALGYVLYERGLGRAHAGEPRDSIAVMPFANLSGDPAKDYFSDGMSEELLNLLARVPGLQVASRTSSFAYKDREVDVRQIGRELGVATVLEGSVRQASDQVRITAQLIDAESGFHLWSETYDRKLADVFQVQDEIAKAIVDKLRIELAPADQQLAQRQKAPTQNVEAYELYLQGRAIWKRRGAENLKRAIELYQAAIGKDPAFARAHAALASAYVVLPGYTKEKDDEEKFFQLAEDCGTPGAGDRSEHRRGARGAGADQRRIVATCWTPSPDSSSRSRSSRTSRRRTSGIRYCWGKSAGSTPRWRRRRKAQELDPTSPILAANLANAYLQKGDDDAALRYAKLASELGLVGGTSRGVETAVAIRRGQWDQARRLLAGHEELSPELRAKAQLFVDALADPAKRPKIVAEMKAMDPKIATQDTVDRLVPATG